MGYPGFPEHPAIRCGDCQALVRVPEEPCLVFECPQCAFTFEIDYGDAESQTVH